MLQSTNTAVPRRNHSSSKRIDEERSRFDPVNFELSYRGRKGQDLHAYLYPPGYPAQILSRIVSNKNGNHFTRDQNIFDALETREFLLNSKKMHSDKGSFLACLPQCGDVMRRTPNIKYIHSEKVNLPLHEGDLQKKLSRRRSSLLRKKSSRRRHSLNQKLKSSNFEILREQVLSESGKRYLEKESFECNHNDRQMNFVKCIGDVKRGENVIKESKIPPESKFIRSFVEIRDEIPDSSKKEEYEIAAGANENVSDKTVLSCSNRRKKTIKNNNSSDTDTGPFLRLSELRSVSTIESDRDYSHNTMELRDAGTSAFAPPQSSQSKGSSTANKIKQSSEMSSNLKSKKVGKIQSIDETKVDFKDKELMPTLTEHVSTAGATVANVSMPSNETPDNVTSMVDIADFSDTMENFETYKLTSERGTMTASKSARGRKLRKKKKKIRRNRSGKSKKKKKTSKSPKRRRKLRSKKSKTHRSKSSKQKGSKERKKKKSKLKKVKHKHAKIVKKIKNCLKKQKTRHRSKKGHKSREVNKSCIAQGDNMNSSNNECLRVKTNVYENDVLICNENNTSLYFYQLYMEMNIYPCVFMIASYGIVSYTFSLRHFPFPIVNTAGQMMKKKSLEKSDEEWTYSEDGNAANEQTNNACAEEEVSTYNLNMNFLRSILTTDVEDDPTFTTEIASCEPEAKYKDNKHTKERRKKLKPRPRSKNRKKVRSLSALPDTSNYNSMGKKRTLSRGYKENELTLFVAVTTSEVDDMVLPFRVSNAMHRVLSYAYKTYLMMKTIQMTDFAWEGTKKSKQGCTVGPWKQRALKPIMKPYCNMKKFLETFMQNKIAKHTVYKNKSSKNDSDMNRAFQHLENVYAHKLINNSLDERPIQNMLRFLSGQKDRRIFVIENRIDGRVLLNENEIFFVRGMPCMKMHIIAPTSRDIQLGLTLIQLNMPRLFASILLVNRAQSQYKLDDGIRMPTTTNFTKIEWYQNRINERSSNCLMRYFSLNGSGNREWKPHAEDDNPNLFFHAAPSIIEKLCCEQARQNMFTNNI